MKRKYTFTSNYVISLIVQQLNFGARRHVRFTKIFKSRLSLRIIWLLYKEGILRTFAVRKDHILVYYKYFLARNFMKLSLVSRPGLRCYWNLRNLSLNYGFFNFTGFYIIYTNKLL